MLPQKLEQGYTNPQTGEVIAPLSAAQKKEVETYGRKAMLWGGGITAGLMFGGLAVGWVGKKLFGGKKKKGRRG